MCTINIIAAKSKNNVIGQGNKLPWHLPSDLKHFKNLTQGKVIIMGRKTYDSIGRPLPNRFNVVISSNSALKLPEGAIVAPDAREALKVARIACLEKGIDEIYVIGGASIYQSFLKRADKMILTVLEKECSGDVLFPQFKPIFWNKTKETSYRDDAGFISDDMETKGLNYTIEEWERIL